MITLWNWLRHVIAWSAIGALSSLLTIGLIIPNLAQASPGKSWVYRGIIAEPQWCSYHGQFPGWNGCWHDDEAGTFTAVDLNWGNGWDDWGAWVELWFNGSSQYLTFFSLAGTACHGLRAVFYSDSGRTSPGGEVHFLHIGPADGVIGTSYVNYNGGSEPYYSRTVGWIMGPENTGCLWDGPHLHQSADTSTNSAFYTNKYGDPTTAWMHEICWSPGPCP
jgi:hypothetical protein